MHSDSHPDPEASRWQFSLRTVFIVFLLFALGLSLWKLGGGYVLRSTLFIGLVIGGAISLLGKNKAGTAPLVIICAAVTGALAAEILGVYAVNFDVEGWDNPLGKLPLGLDDLFWYAFWGGLLSASLGAVGHRLILRSTRRTRRDA